MGKKLMIDDFVERLADKGYTKKDSAVIVRDVLDVIYEAMSRGEEVKLMGFGSFSVKKTKERTHVNVNTGEHCVLPEHNKISFKPGEALKRAAEMAR